MGEKSLISLRLPTDLVEKFDKIAEYLERDRSFVLREALEHYLAEGEEGADLLDEAEGYAELERGETVPFEEMIEDARSIVDAAMAKNKRAS